MSRAHPHRKKEPRFQLQVKSRLLAMDHNTLNDLVELIARLRSEDGCPWDRAQDHKSLRPYLLEEAHEVISAIDAGDSVALADELGDLFLQVLLHCQIASEAGQFCFTDVMAVPFLMTRLY